MAFTIVQYRMLDQITSLCDVSNCPFANKWWL